MNENMISKKKTLRVETAAKSKPSNSVEERLSALEQAVEELQSEKAIPKSKGG